MASVAEKSFYESLARKYSRAFSQAFDDPMKAKKAVRAIAAMMEDAADWNTQSLAPQGRGILANPFFETRTNERVWEPDGWEVSSGDKTTLSFSTADEQQGTRVLTHTGDGSGITLKTKNKIPIDFRKPYRVTVRAQDDAGTATINVYFLYYDKAGDLISGVPKVINAAALASGAFTNFSAVTCAAKEGNDAAVYMKVQVQITAASSVVVDLDSVEVTQVPLSFRAYTTGSAVTYATGGVKVYMPSAALSWEHCDTGTLTSTTDGVLYKGSAGTPIIGLRFYAPWPMLVEACIHEELGWTQTGFTHNEITVELHKNGTHYSMLSGSEHPGGAGPLAHDAHVHACGLVEMDAGDYIEFEIHHNIAVTVTGATTAQQFYCTIKEVL